MIGRRLDPPDEVLEGDDIEELHAAADDLDGIAETLRRKSITLHADAEAMAKRLRQIAGPLPADPEDRSWILGE